MSLADRFWTKVRKTEGCWLWAAARWANGYGVLGIWENGRTRTLSAHRLSWQLHHGPIPDGAHVLHHCDNPACVRPDHLFLGTNDDNIADMFAKGRHRHGETHHNARLADAQVTEIRSRYQRGVISMRALAEEFGITAGHVCDLINEKRRQP